MKFTVTITSALLAVAALTSTADAACAFNNPTEGKSYAAGDSMQIGWFDNPDQEGPACADIKKLAIELRIGSKTQQTPVATVADGVPGDQMGMTWDIPKQLEKTDDTYFLEMHNAEDPKSFQNFSARFAITGVESSGGSETQTDEEESTDTDKDKPTDTETTDEEEDATDEKDKTDTEEPTDDGKNKPDGTQDDNPNGGSNDGGDGAGNNGDNSPDSPDQGPNPNAAASSWFVSFASLAIVTITVTLSNVF